MIEEGKILEWMEKNVQDHTLKGEVNITTLGEDCADHFKVSTELGDSEIEARIFELASEFYER